MILTAYRTYIRIANDFVASDYPGPVVEMYPIRTKLISMWYNCLAIPNAFCQCYLTYCP